MKGASMSSSSDILDLDTALNQRDPVRLVLVTTDSGRHDSHPRGPASLRVSFVLYPEHFGCMPRLAGIAFFGTRFRGISQMRHVSIHIRFAVYVLFRWLSWIPANDMWDFALYECTV